MFYDRDKSFSVHGAEDLNEILSYRYSNRLRDRNALPENTCGQELKIAVVKNMTKLQNLTTI